MLKELTLKWNLDLLKLKINAYGDRKPIKPYRSGLLKKDAQLCEHLNTHKILVELLLCTLNISSMHLIFKLKCF